MPENDDQYADRAMRFNNSIGDVIASFAMGAVDADAKSKDRALERTMRVADSPNIEIRAGTTLFGTDQKLTTAISAPRLALIDSRPLVVGEGELKLHMEVKASRDDAFHVSNTDTVAGGFGLFGAGGGFSATVSVAEDRKRHSDYTSTTDVTIKMVQADVPEGLAKIIDAMNSTVQKGLLLNEKLVDAQVAKITGEADAKGAAGINEIAQKQQTAVDDAQDEAKANQQKAIEAAGGSTDSKGGDGTKV